jgi:hypothetical protein
MSAALTNGNNLEGMLGCKLRLRLGILMRSEDMWRPQATKNLARAAYRLNIWPTGRPGMDLKKISSSERTTSWPDGPQDAARMKIECAVLQNATGAETPVA